MKNFSKSAYDKSIRGHYPVTEFNGLDNITDPKELATVSEEMVSTFLSTAENIDFTKDNKVRRRDGFTLASAGNYHSLETVGSTTFCVLNNVLGTLDDDLIFSGLVTASEKPFSYADTGAGIYCSNGDSIYRVLDGAITELSRAGSYDFNTNTLEDTSELYDAPPPGHILTWMFGRLWVVRDDFVCYSRAYRPDQVNLYENTIELPNVTMLQPTNSGYYIGTEDEVFFINGSNPTDPSNTITVSTSGAIKGTSIVVANEHFDKKDKTGQSVVWESKDGKMLGTPDGTVVPLTINHVIYNDANIGTAFMRELNGDIHHVSSLRNQDQDGQHFRASDIAVAEIKRNGVII